MARLNVRVTPRSSKRALVQGEGVWKAFLHAPAEGGRANEELIELVADLFNVPKKAVSIVRGAKSRLKVLQVDGLDG